jgi:serine/threonine protein kinase
MVSEWLAGGYLFHKLIDLEKYSEDTVIFYFRQVFEGVKYLHDRSIAHLDIRSESCLLDASRRVVKLSSFGNAREIQARM